jgi:hypothetical protein
MTGTSQNRQAVTARISAWRRAGKLAAAWSVLPATMLSLAALAPAAHAATAHAATAATAVTAQAVTAAKPAAARTPAPKPKASAPKAAAPKAAAPADATAQIQSLLDNPVAGLVNLPAGTFSVRPVLVLQSGVKIVGHGTTLQVASGSGNYDAVLAGATPGTDLSGLSITGVTFDQNAAGNPMASVTAAALYQGFPRFVVLISKGTGISLTGDTFANADNVNTIVSGSATSNVTISNDAFTNTTDAPMHDHSSIYTSGTATTITGNTFTGNAAYATAIEVHGDGATITANTVTGYYKAANIDASDVTFTGNKVTAAANPVDLWSTAPAATANVTVSGNVLNINRAYWTSVLHNMGRVIPASAITQQVIRDAASTLPFTSITITANTSS